MSSGRTLPVWLAGAVALSIGVLLLAGIRWLTVTDMLIGRSDFTSSYVGGTLLRTDRDHLYDETTQARLHAQLIAPDREDNLPFVDTPPAAVLVLPVTYLPLHTAYRVWSLGQAVLVLLAVWIAARAAPWPRAVSPAQRVACTVVGAGGAGVLVVLLLGQWDGLNALGLSLAYWCWRCQRHATGGALLALGAVLAKPHLALGLAALVLGWRNRGVLAGAVGAAAAAAAASVLVIGGPAGGDFVAQLVHSTTRWHLTEQIGLLGAAGAVFADTTTAHVVGSLAAAAALAMCVWFGAQVRRDPRALEWALAGAAVLSLLASPHSYPQDTAVLDPALVWCCAAAARDAVWLRRGTLLRDCVMAWTAWNLVAVVTLGNTTTMAVQPLLLLLLAAGAGAAARGSGAAAPGAHSVTGPR